MVLHGQGATEYLVLLAVVLIIALVAIALLGFFPGTASDAQIAENQIYWKSASPIAITESSARLFAPYAQTHLYLRIRNVGAYPVRLTRLYGSDGSYAYAFRATGGYFPLCGAANGLNNISDFYYLAPGEEAYFGSGTAFAMPCDREVKASLDPGPDMIKGAASLCQNSTTSPGTFEMKSFAFEYIEYVEGQQITKRETGTKPLLMKCREPV